MGRYKLYNIVVYIFVLLSFLSVTLISPISRVYAMGSGNDFINAQSGLNYIVLQPTYMRGLIKNSFQLKPCPGSDSYILANYGEDLGFKVYESEIGKRCGINITGNFIAESRVVLNDKREVIVKIYAKCRSGRCSEADLSNYGGYALFSIKNTGILKGVRIVVESSGLHRRDLLKIVKSFSKPLKN